MLSKPYWIENKSPKYPKTTLYKSLYRSHSYDIKINQYEKKKKHKEIIRKDYILFIFLYVYHVRVSGLSTNHLPIYFIEAENRKLVERLREVEERLTLETQRLQTAEEQLELSTFRGLLRLADEELSGRFKIELNPSQRPDPAGSQGARGRSPTKRQRSNMDTQPPKQGEPAGNRPAGTTKKAYVLQRPTLLFCTQACLSGLCRGQPLDARCPNVALHAGSIRASPGQRHALTAAQVCQRIRRQLERNLDDHCECWEQTYGGTGVLFKLTLVSHGYTFVAKGSPAVFQTKLEHEANVYRALLAHQGSAIPVCLGLVHLVRKYSLSSLVEITDMLLSWAGEMLEELDFEADRTMLELERAGLVEDFREANVAWNEETQRAMRFDLGNAWVRRVDPIPEKRGREGSEGDKETQTLGKKAKIRGQGEI